MGGPPVVRPRALFIGTGPFGVAALRAMMATRGTLPVELVGVVTAPGRPAGRKGEIAPSPVERTARELGVAHVLALPSLRPADAVQAVLALDPDLIVLADDGRIVPPALLSLRLGALNLHPSLLPRHRGATPIPATILAGDRQTGVTIIRMDDGIDTGPIVATERVDLAGDESAPELEELLAIVAADLLLRTLGPWVAGRIQPRPQHGSGATMTRLLRREDGRLEPALSVHQLERQVRALQPWPGTYVETTAGRLAVHRASVAAALAGDTPGELVTHGRGLALAVLDGRLVLDEVQLSGGRRMTGEALVRGRPGLIGARAP
jgi:methionyl-tRNA formyltransferase